MSKGDAYNVMLLNIIMHQICQVIPHQDVICVKLLNIWIYTICQVLHIDVKNASLFQVNV